MENTGKIFGISLGPGDPVLSTLKALKALNQMMEYDKILQTYLFTSLQLTYR